MSSPTAETAPRFFYGWVIVFVAAVKGAFNVGSAVFATSVFLVPMQEDLGWSRTLIFGALSVRTLAGGMLSPIVGPWGDHPWAPRVALPIGSVLFGLSFMFVKWADTPLEYYLTYGVLGALGLALTSNPILEGVVLKWFIRKRAQAIMWMQVGPPTGPMIFPLILTFLITAVGWRDAWMWLGIAATAVFLPLSLLVRTSPESMGLLPDGDRPGAAPPPSSAGGRRGVPGNERSFTRAEAIRSKSFWMLCLALALSIVGLPGFQAHWVPYLVDINFSREVAASALVVFGIFSVSARFVWGYLTARHDIRNLMVLQAFLAVLGVFFLLGVQNTVMMYAWAVYHGLTLAVFFQLQALLVVTYFGRGPHRGYPRRHVSLHHAGFRHGSHPAGRAVRLAGVLPGALLSGHRHVVAGRVGRVHDPAAASGRGACDGGRRVTERLSPTYTLVTKYPQFLDLCSTLERCDRIAIDTEADSMHHYPERVCLVQVATPQSTYLLDPLALVDLSPLGPALSSPRVLKLLHGADYDVRGLNRDWGLTITNLFDTHIAARFLGLERVGLAALLLDVLGIDIPKDRRIQRADWSKRPLDDRALEYAAADVCYLFDLHDIMTERLQELGRMEWVREECERQCEVRHTPQDLRDTVLALPESRKLDSRHRAVLLALYRYREQQARRQDRPPSHVLPPTALAAVAADPEAPLETHTELNPKLAMRFGRDIRAVVKEGLSGPPLERPAPTLPPRSRPNQSQVRRLAALKAWRNVEANALGVDASLVWPMRSLERLAREPKSFPEELHSPEVREWQRGRFGASLRRAVKS